MLDYINEDEIDEINEVDDPEGIEADGSNSNQDRNEDDNLRDKDN